MGSALAAAAVASSGMAHEATQSADVLLAYFFSLNASKLAFAAFVFAARAVRLEYTWAAA